MAAEIIKTYVEHFPSVRFVGKMYTEEDRVDGSFDKYWTEWHKNGWLDILKKLPQIENIEKGPLGLRDVYKIGVKSTIPATCSPLFAR